MMLSLILEELVSSAIVQQQDTLKTYKEHYSSRGFINEFATIRLGSHRRAGHTTAIAHCLNLFPKAIVVVPFDVVKDKYNWLGIDSSRIYTSTDVQAGAFIGKSHQIVFVDNSQFMNKRVEDEIMELLSKSYVAKEDVLLVLVQ